ncbi:unnamed protein product, partial [Rhizophagus irregularis]
RANLKKVAPGVNDLAEMFIKVNYFIQGLNTALIERVVETSPATLDAAITRAKSVDQMMIQSMVLQYVNHHHRTKY